jgi:hypothetical protein
MPVKRYWLFYLLISGKPTSHAAYTDLGCPGNGEIKGAVNYLRVLDAKKIAEYSIKERFALLLLSLNYEDLREHSGKYCPEEPTVSGVLNSILREYPDDPRVSQRPKQRRNKISAGYAKVGRWLWTLAASLGFGILLLAHGQLVRIMHVLLPAQRPFFLP